jgi:hypothetical protein
MSYGIRAAFVNPLADALYISNGTSMFEFRSSLTRGSFTWRSKDFVTPAPTCFGALQLVGSGTLTVQVLTDGAVRHTQSVTLSDTGMTVLRLPSGFKARRWALQFSGTGEVKEAYLASTPSELRGV